VLLRIFFLFLCILSQNTLAMDVFRCPHPEEFQNNISLSNLEDEDKYVITIKNITMKSLRSKFFSIDCDQMSSVVTVIKHASNGEISSPKIQFESARIQFFNKQWIQAWCNYKAKKDNYSTTFSILFDLASVVKNWDTCSFGSDAMQCEGNHATWCPISCWRDIF
jgi:hypothetical protein